MLDIAEESCRRAKLHSEGRFRRNFGIACSQLRATSGRDYFQQHGEVQSLNQRHTFLTDVTPVMTP